jgi:small-conductance mechanosensitive channel
MKLQKRFAGWSVLVCALLLSTSASAQDMPKTDDLVKLLGFIRPGGVLSSVFVLIGATLVLRFISNTAIRFSKRFTSRRLLIQRVESITRFTLYLATGLLVLVLSFEINRETLQLVALVFGFGIGLAMKDVAASIIAGITIMFDQPFQVGDRVSYAGQYGDIVKIGLRSVRMLTRDRRIVTIPNNLILTEVTASCNFGAIEMMVVTDFYIGVDQDIELAERLVQEAVLTSRYVYLEKPVVVRMNQEFVADVVAIHLRVKAYVLDTQYEGAFKTDVCKRALAAFRRYEILPPAPFDRPPRDRSAPIHEQALAVAPELKRLQ